MKTTLSITDFIASVNNCSLGTPFSSDRLVEFPSWFGRGQQYLSFIKKNNISNTELLV